MVGIQSHSSNDEIDYHISEFRDILNEFEVWYSSVSIPPLSVTRKASIYFGS